LLPIQTRDVASEATVKIALVSPYDYSYPGGVTEHIHHLDRHLRRLGQDVRIIAPSSRDETDMPSENRYRVGRRIVGVPANQSVARLNFSLTLSGTVRHILDQERFDVIHLHEPFAPLVPITVLRCSRTVNVATFHSARRSYTGYRLGKSILKRYFAKLHGRIAVSVPARHFISKYFPASYEIIPNGVELSQYVDPAIGPFPELRDGSVNLLFVGRLEKRKGLIYLLKALRIVKPLFPSVRLIVVGAFEPDQREDYEDYVRRANLSDVVFKGFVSNEEKVRYYKSCDIFCAPSIGRESQGIILLEAMAAGKPVVASDIDGYRAVLEDGRCGLLAPPGDEAALAVALTRLLSDAGYRHTLAAAAAAQARRYAWEQVAPRILSYYEQTIQAQQRAQNGSLLPSLA
jgi:phosphatidylinositol alpha-mannosyltransferase